ncbi:hypothetical protein [Candidatus Spongiihabitans sp.]|uniref:hypothetical protein n=1 Tax=Candidatus Spongiihabitans sp. TaxID=3101308 RepID=UPI003C700313
MLNGYTGRKGKNSHVDAREIRNLNRALVKFLCYSYFICRINLVGVVKKIGLVGWCGMVGLILGKRMVDKSDFDKINAPLFSTSVPSSEYIDSKERLGWLSDHLNKE